MVQRIVSRCHRTLKQRPKDAGGSIRSRYNLPRSSREAATSHVARLRRQTRYEEVMACYQQGIAMTTIAEQFHMSKKTVRKYVMAGAFPKRSIQQRRQSYRLAPYLPYLQQHMHDGCENARMLWQEMCQQGFPYGYKIVNVWLREYLGKPGRRSSEREKVTQHAFLTAVQKEHDALIGKKEAEMTSFTVDEPNSLLVEPIGSPRQLTWLLLRHWSSLSSQKQPQLAQRFFTMGKERQANQFDDWLEECLGSDIPDFRTFAEG